MLCAEALRLPLYVSPASQREVLGQRIVLSICIAMRLDRAQPETAIESRLHTVRRDRLSVLAYVRDRGITIYGYAPGSGGNVGQPEGAFLGIPNKAYNYENRDYRHG